MRWGYQSTLGPEIHGNMSGMYYSINNSIVGLFNRIVFRGDDERRCATDSWVVCAQSRPALLGTVDF